MQEKGWQLLAGNAGEGPLWGRRVQRPSGTAASVEGKHGLARPAGMTQRKKGGSAVLTRRATALVWMRSSWGFSDFPVAEYFIYSKNTHCLLVLGFRQGGKQKS